MLSGKLGKETGYMWQAIFYLFCAAMLFLLSTEVFPQLAERRCIDRWKESGLSATHTAWLGCMVEIDGRKIPEANVQFRPRFSN